MIVNGTPSSLTSQGHHSTGLIRNYTSEDSLMYHELSMSQASGLNSECDVQVIITESGENDVDKLEYQKPAYVAVGLIMAMTIMSVFFPMVISAFGMEINVYSLPSPKPCTDQCRITLVESIPQNLTYPDGSPSHLSTFDGWMNLLDLATESIDIASFYWTLRGEDVYKDPSDWQGETIFKRLAIKAKDKNIRLRIAVNSSPDTKAKETEELEKLGAEVRALNFSEFLGSGILHTKLWIIDGKHFYIGSANMDWRSLTQVKELGAILQNCTCLAMDVYKIFEVYWYMGKPGAQIPSKWPSRFETNYNVDTPVKVSLDGISSHTYLSSSPPQFCPTGRTSDIQAILDVINKAEQFVYVAVMDYFPTTLYTYPRKFWPVIDDALRRVALEKNVEVRVMASWWNNSRPDMKNYLQSLADLNGAMHAKIQTKLFKVPAFTPAQEKIPFARVNHNKYMVTDNCAYIGTSNWSGDYFTSTGGIGMIINQTAATGQVYNDTKTYLTVQQQLAAIFVRDWNSTYAFPVNDVVRANRKKL